MHITHASAADAPRLFEVWEASVRATHDFLDSAAIDALAPIVRDLLHSFSPILCVRDEDGLPFAFMGTQGSMLEMLFIHPSRRGQGVGRLLAHHAVTQLGVTEVDVNEDNRQALGFYERLGFRPYRRSPLDGFGNPYPILHLRLEREASSDRQKDMPLQATQKLYEAIIWGPDPDIPGKRVSVVAESLMDAKTKLEKKYGEGTVFNLHNEADASARR